MCQVIHMDLYHSTPLKEKTHCNRTLQIREILIYDTCDKSHKLCIELDRDNTNQNTRPYVVARYHLNQGQKEGWCTEYGRDGKKTLEGWYTNGKQQGIHRSYGKNIIPQSGSRKHDLVYFLQVENHYLDGDLTHKTQYDINGDITIDHNVVNGYSHGFVRLPRVGTTQLHIHGVLVLYDVEEELGIDLANITEADYFTLSMLGL